MKILLLNLPWQESGRDGVRAGSRWPHLKDKPENDYLPFPFFLAYATSILKKNKFSAKLLDGIAEKYSKEKLYQFIKEYQPSHIIIETSTITLAQDVAFAETVHHQCSVIFVGPDPHIHNESFLTQHSCVDFTIKGEYEFTLLNLMKALSKNTSLYTVDGLRFRDGDAVIANRDRPLCCLDDLPWPERTDVPMNQYNDTPGSIPMPSVQMLASRGCPFGCIFCLWPSVMYGGRNYRMRSYIDVVDEMEYLVSQGFQSVYFDDDTFGLNREWVLAFCDEIIKRNKEGRINIPWAMMSRADCLDSEMLFAMRDAGLTAVKYGVESASPDLLRMAGKEYDRRKLEATIGQTKELGIKTHLTFTIGLPGESKRSANDTIFYAFHLGPVSVQFSITTPFPGTPFYEDAKKKGNIVSYDWSEYDGNYHAVVKTGSLSTKEIVRLKDKAYHLWGIFSRYRNRNKLLFYGAKLYCYFRVLDFPRIWNHLWRFLATKITFKRHVPVERPSLFLCSILKPFGRLVRYAGVFHGERAFVGPSLIQIDLTNDCNNDCIGCWCNSPLLDEKKLQGEEKKQYLSFSTFQKLIDDAHAMKTQEVYLAGGGEPFMYPYIMEAIHYIKAKKMVLYINTNFTLVDVERVKQLVHEGVDHLTVSVWAGTPSTYAKTHPNKNEKTFIQLENMLKYMQSVKKHGGPPYIKIYNVISKVNYHELDYMYDFVLRTKAESVEFTVLDTIPEKTDILMLNHDELKQLRADACALQKRVERLTANGQNPPLLFRFEQFMRRISSEDSLQGEYDKSVIDSVPCTVGWTFSRIVPNGDVHGCLKSHRIPVGNLYEQNFYHIWHSPQQRYFRKMTHVREKQGTFFSSIGNDPHAEIGCYKGCDDLGRNEHIEGQLRKLNKMTKTLLIGVAKTYKFLADIKNKRWRECVPYEINTKIARKLRKQSIVGNVQDIELRGIAHGSRAFKGPTHVVIDITNRCNNSCIGCWMYSPLLKEHKVNPSWAQKELSYKTIRTLLRDLKKGGTEIVRFTGGGEPLLHPDFPQCIRFARQCGFKVCVTTSLSIITDDILDALRDVDDLAISIWAGDRKTYEMHHPHQQKGYFDILEKTIKKIIQGKNRKQSVTLCSVITNKNYKTIDAMLSFARRVGVDKVYFTLVDPVEPETTELLLDEEECECVSEYFQEHESKNAEMICIENKEGFLSRVSNKNRAQTGQYDSDIIDSIPCYIGWHFSRILANGDVVPCCRAVKKVIGNIKKERFINIWYGKRQDEFRNKALRLSKFDPYFSEIECYKTCDNLMQNRIIHERWLHSGWMKSL